MKFPFQNRGAGTAETGARGKRGGTHGLER